MEASSRWPGPGGGALLILLKIDDTHRDLWVSDGTAAGTRLLKAGFVDAVYFDAAAPEAAYFHSAHADVSGDHYWRADANGATPLDTQGVISANGYLAATIYQGDLWATDGARVVRVPAGSTTGEVMLNGVGSTNSIGCTRRVTPSTWDRHLVAMEPIEDVLAVQCGHQGAGTHRQVRCN